MLLGLTIKPLSVLIGLNEGLFTTETYYYDRGVAFFGRNDAARVVTHRTVHTVPCRPSKAIEVSSNAFMVDMIGEGLYRKYGSKGIEVWDKYMKDFGLGVSTGVDLCQMSS